jgi:hypothetical protein
MHDRRPISIWFFIGLLLLIYGIAILGSGLLMLGRPSASRVVLSELHAPIWWGALLIVLGALYFYKFSPWRKS